MVTKFVLRPFSLPLYSLSPPHLSLKPLSLSLLSTATAPSHQALTLISYGPSLHKGQKPSPSLSEPDKNDDVIDRESFARVFHISAIRVPADKCFALESRLRGHLLNWPRVRNIARVPGDDIEPELKHLLDSGSDSDPELVALNRRIYGKAEGDGEEMSAVLYRDLLARKFNSKGFVRFRNLAKLSRPRKKESGKGRERGERGEGGRNVVAEVEVIEDEDGGDMSGLLGEKFRGGVRWRGLTRLLLLDEECAGKGVEELPEAIKAVLKEERQKDNTSAFELVRCKITLFYTYWQMNEILEALLPQGWIIPSAFETVGHIAHLNLRDEHLPYKEVIAKVVLDKNKPKIQTVVNKIDAIHNDFRTMQLEVLAGNHSLVTTVVENGLRFHVDLATVYWNSRLATERQKLLNDFTRSDVVCDVFAGVGPIAVSAARIVKYVYANDLNPHAVDYLERNSVLNKLERKIEVFNMDGRRFIDAIFSRREGRLVTQVVMNLPNDAVEYLDVFRGIFRSKSKGDEIILPKIHVYGFSKAQDPEFEFQERIRIALSDVAFEVEMRRVRLVAPGKWMLCASFTLPESVALAKPSQNYVYKSQLRYDLSL